VCAPRTKMIEREPKSYWRGSSGNNRRGKPGGPDPLGARRALYLLSRNGKDTYFRIHGHTTQADRGALSRMADRMLNETRKDFYQRVPIRHQSYVL